MHDSFKTDSSLTLPADHTLTTCPYPEDVIFELMAGVDWVSHREFHPNEVFGSDRTPDVCAVTRRHFFLDFGARMSLTC